MSIAARDVSEVCTRVRLQLIGGPPPVAITPGAVERMVRTEAPLLSVADVARAVELVLADTTGLGVLEPLLRQEDVTEVMVNGAGPIWIERRGRVEATDVVLDEPSIYLLIERIVSPLGLRIDRSSPLVDARLADGSRVNAIVPPLSLDGPCITIRRFGAREIPLREFCEGGLEHLLQWAVHAKMNVLVSGATAAGKTTLLNALAAHIPPSERVVTVEDAAELRLPLAHVVRLEARPANAEGAGRVTVRDLVRNALRMRPDRIVVGEVRGPEALDMLQAMNTGHEGSLSTCHANSPLDALRRVESMVLMGEHGLPLGAVREQISSTLDLVVQVARGLDGVRRVAQIAEVLERPGGQDGERRIRTIGTAGGLRALPLRPARWLQAPPPRDEWLS